MTLPISVENIGIMQGRLLPKYLGRYQAHPVGYWQREFDIAAEIGLGCIEWILDFNQATENPIMSDTGILEIQKAIKNSGVSVRSVCADYFMEAPLHSENFAVAKESHSVMEKLLKNANILGVKDVVLPCVDQSSLKDLAASERLVKALHNLEAVYSELNVNISLETDLSPLEFKNLLQKLPHKNITVNYDTGNSAALGYSITEEFEAYGNRISDIHIKDRELGGGSVVLGTGNTNFNTFFTEYHALDYHGPIIMQVYRDDEGVEIFKKQYHWFLNQINQINI
jgi:L-ribulose-5-phosphate 3-epimerase